MQALQSKLPASGVTIFSVMSRLAEEHGAINLGQGFPDFNCDPELVETVSRYMRDGHNQYAPMLGVFPLREALARKIELLYGRRYDPATEIGITAGATRHSSVTLTALVRPGDEVVLFQPAYDSYAPAVQLSGGIPIFVTLRRPDYRVDWDEVRSAISPRTRVIVVNTPHNPTGTMFDRDDIERLAELLQITGAFVVSDEVYEHIVFDGARHESIARHPEIAARAVVISSFGKTYHATGWKIGYYAAPRQLRGLAVIAEAKKAIPNKPIKYVVNTHAHFDHASGLAPFAADGSTIITHANNKTFLEKALSGPRTLVGDTLAKAGKKPKVESAGDKRVLKDETHTIELYHIKDLAHSDGMLVAYLPKEKILFTGDFNIPGAGQPPAPAIATLIQNVERLKLDFEGHVLVHAPNPDRPLTKADLMTLAKGTQ